MFFTSAATGERMTPWLGSLVRTEGHSLALHEGELDVSWVQGGAPRRARCVRPAAPISWHALLRILRRRRWVSKRRSSCNRSPRLADALQVDERPRLRRAHAAQM